jgi:tetratricopeptide (TPR) repeat protein
MKTAGASFLLVWTCALVLAAAAPRPARAAGDEAEGHRHARRANHLADVNKCRAAIPEYDKALRLIKDSTLLFNRAECYRKTGQADKALADYRQFLVELPKAPNRAQVEAQIAALEKATAPAPAAPPAAGHGGAAPVTAEKDKKDKESLASAKDPGADDDRPTYVPMPPLASQAEPAPVLVDTPRPAAQAETAQGSGHLWIWVGLGAVIVAGAAVGTFLVLNQGKTDVPTTALGNYRF